MCSPLISTFVRLAATRGLDASTALDYAKSLRILTDVFQQTTFSSLYQAGEGIVRFLDPSFTFARTSPDVDP